MGTEATWLLPSVGVELVSPPTPSGFVISAFVVATAAPIVFVVQGVDDPALVDVAVRLTSGTETVFSAEEFAPEYAPGSSFRLTTDGLRFTVRRAARWPEPGVLTLVVRITDDEGEVTEGVFTWILTQGGVVADHVTAGLAKIPSMFRVP